MLYWSIVVTILLIILLQNRRYRWIYILYKTLPRDITAGYRFLKLNLQLLIWTKSGATVPKIFSQLAHKHPHKVAFYYEENSWTFQQLEEFSNGIANYFKNEGYKKGDAVALLLENRPEYVGIWLGLSKLGVVTALINTNLVSGPLVHSLRAADCQALIYGDDFSGAISSILEEVNDLKLYQFGEKKEALISKSVNLNEEIGKQPIDSPKSDVAGIRPHDKLIYIYTSGTTGLPKAAVVSNNRYMFITAGLYFMTTLSQEDVYYSPLPLYHSAAGIVAVGQALVFGLTVLLRRKFSASNYWSDCVKYKCTVSNYIGELCRYLLAVHKPGTPVEHSVKKMFGNGLRPQIWRQFIDTFRIGHIYEFYGATEGNSNLMNIDNTVGAVGFVPRYASFIYSVILIRCDEDTGQPLRDAKGLCTQCKPNQPGLLIGKINPKMAHSDFAGYADRKATEKKLLRDVFKPGDVYFNSGDTLLQDELGYYYFKDRTGDTFRWKGENVATSEVEGVLSDIIGLKDAVVYGVQVPGTEGRAGMAAIVNPDNSLDLTELVGGLKSKLPSYAIPMFLRIMDSLPMTGTFKLKKVDLQRDGIDYDVISDHRLYFYDTRASEYRTLTREVYEDIISGKFKL